MVWGRCNWAHVFSTCLISIWQHCSGESGCPALRGMMGQTERRAWGSSPKIACQSFGTSTPDLARFCHACICSFLEPVVCTMTGVCCRSAAGNLGRAGSHPRHSGHDSGAAGLDAALGRPEGCSSWSHVAYTHLWHIR